MKRAVITISVAIFLLTPSVAICASVLDQHVTVQPTYGCTPITAYHLVAQTFSPGMSGLLEQVELYLEPCIGVNLYPALTVEVRETVDGAPVGKLLGSAFSSSLANQGWNGFDFLAQAISLTKGKKYAIVLYNDDYDHTIPPATCWALSDELPPYDDYLPGEYWQKTEGRPGFPNQDWATGDEPVDGVFRTFIVPEEIAVDLFLAVDDPVIPRPGTLNLQATVINITNRGGTVVFASKVRLPDGRNYPPSGFLYGPVEVYLTPHGSQSLDLSHSVPSGAPSGVYTYYGYVGYLETGVIAQSEFEFEVAECMENPDCEWNEFCQKATGDCDALGGGRCKPRPSSAKCKLYLRDPICGCDGMTYANACWAARAGVSVAHEGACMP